MASTAAWDTETYWNWGDLLVRLVGLAYLVIFLLDRVKPVVRGVRAHLISKIIPYNIKKNFGEWAAVTGCTDGIGRAYSRELAKRGINLILIGRNQEKLNSVSKEIGREFPSVQLKTVVADFSEDRPEVYDRIQEQLERVQIGILVNNVGVVVPYPMRVDEMTALQVREHVAVNVASCSHLTRLVLPVMRARRRGAIVNLSSMAAQQPMPLFAVYAATKAYVESFSKALREECRGSGVSVQTVAPGFVNTRMVSYSPRLTAGGIMVPSAATFARHALDTLGSTPHTTGYAPHGIQFWLSEMVPPECRQHVFLQQAVAVSAIYACILYVVLYIVPVVANPHFYSCHARIQNLYTDIPIVEVRIGRGRDNILYSSI